MNDLLLGTTAHRSTKGEQVIMDAVESALLAYANSTPLVLSLLYDIDMMPEQILATDGMKSRAWMKMLIIIEAMREAAKSASEQPALESAKVAQD